MEFKNFFYYFCCCMSEKPVEQTEYVTYNDIYILQKIRNAVSYFYTLSEPMV